MSSERFKLHSLDEPYDGEAGDTVEIVKLKLEDTQAQTQRGLRVPHSSSGAGCNPYDTIPNTSSTATFKRHKDLRELSEWIRMKRQVQQLKNDDEDES
jgi:hypothetical protein